MKKNKDRIWLIIFTASFYVKFLVGQMMGRYRVEGTIWNDVIMQTRSSQFFFSLGLRCWTRAIICIAHFVSRCYRNPSSSAWFKRTSFNEN